MGPERIRTELHGRGSPRQGLPHQFSGRQRGGFFLSGLFSSLNFLPSFLTLISLTYIEPDFFCFRTLHGSFGILMVNPGTFQSLGSSTRWLQKALCPLVFSLLFLIYWFSEVHFLKALRVRGKSSKATALGSTQGVPYCVRRGILQLHTARVWELGPAVP